LVFTFSHWFAKYRNFECRCLAMGFVFIRDRKTRKVVTMFSDCYEKLWQKKYLVALFFFSRSTTVSWWMMFVIWGEEYCEDSFLGSAIFTFTHCFLSSCKSTPSFPSWNTFLWSQVQKWEIGSSDLSSRLKKLLEMLCVFVSIWFFQRGGIWLGRNDCGGLDYWGWKDSWCSGLNVRKRGDTAKFQHSRSLVIASDCLVRAVSWAFEVDWSCSSVGFTREATPFAKEIVYCSSRCV